MDIKALLAIAHRYTRISMQFFLPVAGLVVFAFLFDRLQSLLQLQSLDSTSLKTHALDIGIFWGSFELLLLMSIAFAIAYSLRIIQLECATPPAIGLIWPLALILLVATPLLVWLHSYPAGGSFTAELVAKVESAGRPGVERLVDIGNYLAALAFVMIAVAASLLAQTRHLSQIEELSRKLNQYRTLLWAAAAIVVFALLEIYFLLTWGAKLQGTSTFDTVARHFSLIAGIFGSALLAAMFTPTALALQGAIARMTIDQYLRDSDLRIGRWQRLYGLDKDPIKGAWSLAAVFGPIVSGVFQTFVKHFFAS